MTKYYKFSIKLTKAMTTVCKFCDNLQVWMLVYRGLTKIGNFGNPGLGLKPSPTKAIFS